MRIRWKLLLLLLAFSVMPMALMRVTAQTTMLDLGRDLAERGRNALLHRASTELQRLVADHARVLGRERELLETVLEVQALRIEHSLVQTCPLSGEGLPDEAVSSGISKLFVAPPGQTGGRYDMRPDDMSGMMGMMGEPGMMAGMMGMPGEEGAMRGMRRWRWDAPGKAPLPPRSVLSEWHCITRDDGICSPLPVSYEQAVYRFPPGVPEAEETEEALRLSAAVPDLKTLARRYQDVILWQTLTLDDGLQAVYPAHNHFPVGYDPLGQHWFKEAMAAGKEKKSFWTRPALDPFTGQIALTVARRIEGPGGTPSGVTAIVVPSRIFVHENKHVRELSDHVSTFLVSAPHPDAGSEDAGPDGAGAGLLVLAREERDASLPDRAAHGHMLAPAGDEILASPDAAELSKLEADILAGRPGVRPLTFKGTPSLWAYGPVDDKGTALVLVVPSEDITREARATESYVLARVDSLLRGTGYILAILVLTLALTAFATSSRLTRSLQALSAAAARLGSGDFSTRAKVESSDEIGELAETFNAMVPALEERLRIKDALRLAQDIQHNLLPAAPPSVPGLDVAGATLYCDETGGDFYDYMSCRCGGEDGTALAVGDVTGHGVPAALLMATARGFLRARMGLSTNLGEAATAVNRLLAQDTFETGHFLTLFLLELDVGCDRLRWVRAGHDPALLYDPERGDFEDLSGEGAALGLFPDAEYVEHERVGLRPGQLVVVGTDGIWEASSPDGAFYGKERMKEVIRSHASQGAREIMDAVLADLAAFRVGAPQEDDVTLVILRVTDDVPA